ncbi:CDGSH iron-sulfur domain-containing protein 3, mitochondrial [Sitophilus oryzae]|uniref:CDGSH iron-sulfur domain-containing protein 3, mitochondrial n=1 Tax=Sitophilus oryzae TaxID=7048 RepID=A0A6J2Y9J2_SITOR|nr:CDGSH iron-sulfur domain-containing protein 3, mitochondrial [Sitophilus oryzae]
MQINMSLKVVLNSKMYPGYTFSMLRRFYSSKGPSEIPKNKLEGIISADHQSDNGIVYDKKPFRITLEAGRRYSWCLCGRSHRQPFCDGTHKNEQLKIKQKPIRFVVEETKEYWLCNCKQTSSRPFCDGTHKTPVVQEGSSTIR